MRLIDNPTTFTKEGVERALRIREIANDQGVSDMLWITAAIWLAAAAIIALPLYRRSKAASISVFSAAIAASVPMAISFNEINFNMMMPSTDLSMMDIFHLCDGIIIMFGYAYGVSYEAANLIVFAIIQPAMIIYLASMTLLNHGYKFRK